MPLDLERPSRGNAIADPVAQLGRKRSTRLPDGIGVRIEGKHERGLFGKAERQPPAAAAKLEHALVAEVAEPP